jgi:beta-barrel assembly-enhancing protease
MLLFLLAACSKDGGVNIFSIQDDLDLGAELAAQIEADPKNYPLLDEAQFPDAYNKLYAIRDSILASDAVEHDDEFVWELHIVDDPTVLNAFCAPGGYIYVYTGIIAFLDHEDHLAGVMGHEMAHAAERHSTEQLTKIYGIQTLLSFLLGDASDDLAVQIAASLVTLEFSRDDESEADRDSVEYLCETDYAADGAAGFFAKLIELDKSGDVPEFLSTHPSSDSRVEDIEALADAAGCNVALWDTDGTEIGELQAALPL